LLGLPRRFESRLMLKLQIEPLADCGRYDHLREVSHVLH
jgi:hypothetical protein